VRPPGGLAFALSREMICGYHAPQCQWTSPLPGIATSWDVNSTTLTPKTGGSVEPAMSHSCWGAAQTFPPLPAQHRAEADRSQGTRWSLAFVHARRPSECASAVGSRTVPFRFFSIYISLSARSIKTLADSLPSH
jgi:hypothetical protein